MAAHFNVDGRPLTARIQIDDHAEAIVAAVNARH
jgi:hypothetical protein